MKRQQVLKHLTKKWGATDIKVTASKTSTFYFYKSWYDKIRKKHYKVVKNKKSTKHTTKYSFNHHYYVVVKSKDGNEVKCTIKQHKDSKKNKKGIRWISKKNSPMANSHFFYKEKIYFSKSNVAKALEMIDEDETLDRQTKLKSISWFLGTAVLTSYAGGKFVKGLFAALEVRDIVAGVDFKKLTKKQLKKCSGYKYDKKKKKGTAKKGVVITYYYYDGLPLLDVQSWAGKKAYGAGGSIGKWVY